MTARIRFVIGVRVVRGGFGERTRRLVIPVGVLASLVISFLVPRALDTARCLPMLGRVAKRYRRVSEPLGGLQVDEPALGYYSGCRPTERWSSPKEVAAAAQRSPTRSVLVWLEASDGVPLARDPSVGVTVMAEGFNLIDPTAQGLLELCRVTAR